MPGRTSRARTGYYQPMLARVRALPVLVLVAAATTAPAAQATGAYVHNNLGIVYQ